MKPAGRSPGEVDWEDLAEAVGRFSAATGLCISAYDRDGRRRLGPVASSRVVALMQACGAFHGDGKAAALEQRLVRAVLARGGTHREAFDDALHVLARPLRAGDPAAGAVVFGWVFCAFPTSLGCQRIARTLDIDAARLWAQARLEPPMPQARLLVSAQLLETLLDSMERQAGAVERLHDLARMREGFLARVSHELRTPLSALQVRTELLLRGTLEDPGHVRAELEKMKRHIAEQARLVEDLIEAARTQTGQLSIKRQPGLVGPILLRAIDLVRPAALAKGVALHAPDEASLARLAVLADAERLQQAVWNVLANAVKFTPPQGTVRVTVHATQEAVHVAVSDTGAGIDAAVLPLIFEPFTKKDEGNAEGLGLGLSIARHIVELHDGKIWVRSQGPGSGSTFHLELPRQRDLHAGSDGAAP